MRSKSLHKDTYNFVKYWNHLDMLPHENRRLLARKRLKLRKLLEEFDEQAKHTQ